MENKETKKPPVIPHQYLLQEKDIPEGKVSFKIGYTVHPDGSLEKQVMIGGEIMDYSIDYAAYMEAHKMGLGAKIKEDIAKHYIKCVSEMVGRKVTAKEIMNAENLGYI